jgi:hypothetical protein
MQNMKNTVTQQLIQAALIDAYKKRAIPSGK